MIDQSPVSIFPLLRDYLHSKLGLSYSEKQEVELLRKLGYAASDFGFDDSIKFANWLLKNDLTKKQLGDLASHLTIGETYFFRERKSFDFLEQIYLPGLIRKRYESERFLRVWCAGCATGEEAYSLAIVLLQSIPDIHRWNISILATDINNAFLEKAKRGVYSRWSFRTNSDEFILKYFTRDDSDRFHIKPEIKRMVTFSSLNLGEDIYPSVAGKTDAVDIIFCRNVLIYFSQEGYKLVTERFYNSLTGGGILVVSPVEMSGMISAKFNKIHYSGFTIYQKDLHHRDEKSKFPPKDYPVTPAAILPVNGSKNDPGSGTGILVASAKTTNTEAGLPPGEIAPEQIPSVETELEIAEALFRNGALEEAELILAGLVDKIEDFKMQVVLLLAKIKANLGKLHEAEILCERGIALDKLNPNLYYLLATVMQEQGNDDKAIISLKQALYIDPDFILAHFLFGTLSLKQGDQTQGKQSFKNAISSLSKLKPEDILPYSDGLTVERFRHILKAIK